MNHDPKTTQEERTSDDLQPPRRSAVKQKFLTFVGLFMDTGIFQPEEWQWRRMARTGMILLLVVFVLAVLSQGITHVRENHVGIQVNNITGELTLKDNVGFHIYVPYLYSFYVLDKTIQKLELTWAQTGQDPTAFSPGEARRDINLKMVDGYDVSLDAVVNFKLNPEQAITVLQQSGRDMRFAKIWIESYARHVSLELFGQLTSEQMYDAHHRNVKAEECLVKLNQLLNPQGVEVIAFIPGEFRFYKDYIDVITEKKLADQEVEEQQAQARAALQNQQRQVLEARKAAEVRIRSSEGELQNRIIQARAEADRIRREADQYYLTTQRAAEAAIYSASSEAQGLRANLLAEAEGMEEMREALTGAGGIGLIGLEYAKRLRDVRFSGTPITRDPHIQQFSIQEDRSGFGPIPPSSFSPAAAATQGGR